MKFTKRPWKFIIKEVGVQQLIRVIEDAYQGNRLPCMQSKFNFRIVESISKKCHANKYATSGYRIYVTNLTSDPEISSNELAFLVGEDITLRDQILSHIEKMADEINRVKGGKR